METIVSISTPIGKGAISVVRMSGEKSLDMALRLFHAKNLNKENVQPRYMYFGKLELDEGLFEECLMVYFKNPFSYTGEDIVEFQVHGGVLLAQKVVQRCLDVGARMAEAGEFSKRAFLNGKITLDKAEAIIGEINAEAEGELKSSLQVTNGRLAQEILSQQENLKLMLAEIEVGMDYPDEVEELGLILNVKEKLQSIFQRLEQIIASSQSAKYLKNGINVALVGKTNVGKSSVMNSLLGSDRAIVTDIKGTTRDSITESFEFGGIKINLIDTAGIRETEDVVESLGIEKSKQTLSSADVILFVLDGSETLSEEDKFIEKLVNDKNVLRVVNKTDKNRVLPKFDSEIEISALEGKNIDKLKQKIVDMVILQEIDFNALVLTNERQIEVLKLAQSQLREILQTENLSLDVLSMLIKNVWKSLGKITGNTENEDIIDLIFSKFCLGK
ncbi:MAG: tRNA uridine-5-carboxymethylaminomethyl(34) synthesis GTPase MnmE [Clostridia bacterium]|nr:tRNA uridine-5-carboxymethylaminomethyl(34) synthesis GTPase MnmE [Clostridia bacterium]